MASPRAALRDLDELAAAAAGCRACPLWRDATQMVFGEGPPSAAMVLVGEQPGDQEDRLGRPFVGPAGRLLDETLAEAGIERVGVYLTNAVKHFKWKARGKRRIHDKPASSEVAACRPWLDGELGAIRPEVLVLLGATAAQGLLGRSFRVTRSRGVPIEDTGLARYAIATVHPSSILRGETPMPARKPGAASWTTFASRPSCSERPRCLRPAPCGKRAGTSQRREVSVPGKSAHVKNEKQYEALKDKGMSKERAAKIANSPGASKRGGKRSGSGGSSSQGGTTAQKKAAGRKGGRATARKS
jgi:uracil-DNA glycosylase